MRCLTFLALILCLVPAPSAAQEPAPPIFPQVVPNPTGKNGYEELVRAVDVLRASKQLEKAEVGQGEGRTLAFRRAMLQEKPVVEALRLVRQGLSKPVFSPRIGPGPRTLFPELSGFRRIARLLMIQQYVLLADGRTREAIEVSRLGLRFGSAIQVDTLMAGLVGIAVNALATAPVAAHLDQLSSRDCEALFRVCQEWLAQPDPTIRTIEAERRFALRAMEEIRTETQKVGAGALRDFIGGDEDPQSRALRAQLPQTPAELEALQQQTTQRMERYYERMMAELHKPYWQRKLETPDADGTVAGQMAALLTPVFTQATAAYVRDRARIQLLACHALVLRFRWEHNRLPASLAELRVGDLALDPFTGQPLRYEPAGLRYRLYSVGAEAPPEDERAVDGRRPVSVVPGEF